MFTLNSDLSQLLRSFTRSRGRPDGNNPTPASDGGKEAKARKFCTEPNPTGNGKGACDPGASGGDATESSPTSSADRAEKEATKAEATRQLGRPGIILPRVHPLRPSRTQKPMETEESGGVLPYMPGQILSAHPSVPSIPALRTTPALDLSYSG